MTPILTHVQHGLLASAPGRPDIGWRPPSSPLIDAIFLHQPLPRRAPR